MQSLNGIPPDGQALLDFLQVWSAEEAIRDAGGYTPPHRDPRNCEPVPGQTEGGFSLRMARGIKPFDRCQRINCSVQEACTAILCSNVLAKTQGMSSERKASTVEDLKNTLRSYQELITEISDPVGTPETFAAEAGPTTEEAELRTGLFQRMMARVHETIETIEKGEIIQ
jgi:hypothetical protein